MNIESHTLVFHNLSPDAIINLVEKSLGENFSNICRPHNSYINRVYELTAESGESFIVKFYRPGRWSRQALLDEHEFLLEMSGRDIPVIAPIELVDGNTLGVFDGVHYTLFPKKGGQFINEYNEDQWLELGRLLGRVHAAGTLHPPIDRITIHPGSSTTGHLNFIREGNFLPEELAQDFFSTTEEIIREITPRFTDTEMIRIHGDCHFSNLIFRPGESFYIIDFDDFGIGPPVQDFWMLLPDLPEKSLYETELFLDGYETFRPFHRKSLQLIEPLRAMRFIHFIAWCAHQVRDGGNPPSPDWGSFNYWSQEISDLKDQLERIRENISLSGNM